MNLSANIRKLATNTWTVLALVFLFAACDSVIYDEEGDCQVTYRVKFRYDMNMKFADAFAHEVKSVALYAFSSDGKLVWQNTESGDALAADDYAMTLPLNPGNYNLLAWCGLDNGESFTVPVATVAQTQREQLLCYMNRHHDEADQAYIDTDLHPLFHGSLPVTLSENDAPGVHTFTVPLVKNTNHVRIILQHLSGEDVNVDDFTFQICDNNGWMGHDNALLADEQITYHAWNTESGEAGIGSDDDANRAITTVRVAIADLTVARLMEDHRKNMILTIRNKRNGDLVARIPLIDYALLVKGYYNREMTNQEYLDRQDEYALTFFLDENHRWISSSILINSWRVVLSDVDIE